MDDNSDYQQDPRPEVPETTRPWGDSEHDPVLHSKLRPQITPGKSYDAEWGHYRDNPKYPNQHDNPSPSDQ